ncbi:MAG: hypothetical protein M1833_004466 [Piccolia ochrophora]|nr:MAG: hypothetical protein M1833_004466 [Piccolia ochrophora]
MTSSLADQSANMIAHEDFSLYSDLLAHDPTAQQAAYHGHGTQQYSMDSGLEQYPGMSLSSHDGYSSVMAYSANTRAPFFGAPQFVVDAPQEVSKHGQFHSPPTGSPATSASQSFDQPSSNLSSASGASVPSAASSAIGSPYSGASHRVAASDSWGQPGPGLGIHPGIVPPEGFNPEGFGPHSLESEILFTTGKASNDYVASIQAGTGHHTIDTILEEVSSQVNTPRPSNSPVRNPSDNAAGLTDLTVHGTRSRFRAPSSFRSPVIPASANRPLSPNSSSPHTYQGRRHSHAGSGITKSYRKDTPRQWPSSLPSPEMQEPVQDYARNFQSPFFSQSSDPSLIHALHTPTGHSVGGGDLSAYNTQPTSYFHPPSPAASPALSNSSARSHRPGSVNIKTDSQSPSYLSTHTFQPYPVFPSSRRLSTSSNNSRFSYGSGNSLGLDSDEDQKGRCPNVECGKIFKDLKAHMLTHQSERPEKCPIMTCEYHQKGFARKYDKNRHTLTHYKGTMVCGFCPGSGSAAEKSFNRADVFKRHLTSVHGVEQTPPNSRKKASAAASGKKFTDYAHDATGKCSTCSGTFTNAQEFYEHLDDCVLRVVQQEDPSEAINQRHLASMDHDEAVERTMRANALPTESSVGEPTYDEEEVEDNEVDGEDHNEDGVGSHVGGGNSIHKVSRATSGVRGRGLTFSKGGVPLVGKGRKKRKNYPLSWGCSPDKMKMKKRVLCVYDGQRRLWKDDMMLDNEFEVRLKLGEGSAYVTDLDVKTLERAQAFHNATDEEKGPWMPELPNVSIEELMS